MSPKRTLEAELAKLSSLRNLSSADATPEVAKALTDRNNLIVAKAADLALHHHLTGLVSNVAAAFPRFLENSTASDPQCWAQNALAKTLAAFAFQDQELFLHGHAPHPSLREAGEDRLIPLELSAVPVPWRSFSAANLIAIAFLGYLVPVLTDKELSVRVNVVRAIEQVGTDSATLLLRLLAELASEAPEVLSACYSGVLAIEGLSALDWVARFLGPGDDPAAEAAMAIAQTHSREAFRLLQPVFGAARDRWFRTTVLTAIALTRQQEATDWLISLIAKGGVQAADAHQALCRSAPSVATQERLKQLGRPCG